MIRLSPSERNALIRSALLGGKWRGLCGGNCWVRQSRRGGSCDDRSACRGVRQRVGRWGGRIGRGGAGGRGNDDRWGGSAREAGRKRGGPPGTVGFAGRDFV